MIIQRQKFELGNQTVIEKLHIKTPFRYGAVFQDEACFLFMKQGETVLHAATESLELQTSDSVLLKCGSYFADLMQNTEAKECEIIAIHLHKDILQTLYKDEVPVFLKTHTDKPFARKIAQQGIVSHFIQILDFYFQHPALVNDELLKLKIKELILLLLQTKNAANILNLFAHLFTPWQADFKEVVQAHLFSNITISELAVLAGRSLSSFKRDFEKIYNHTPANYLKEQKLQKAAELLLSTDQPVSDVCYQVGFTDTSHFARLFKVRFGVTPSGYRAYVHLHPAVPADVLPLKIKPPYIPGFFLIIVLSNIYFTLVKRKVSTLNTPRVQF